MASNSSGMVFVFLVNMVTRYQPMTLSHNKIVARPRAMEEELLSFQNGLSFDAKYDRVPLQWIPTVILQIRNPRHVATPITTFKEVEYSSVYYF